MSIERTFDLIINAGTSSPLVINANQNDSGEIWKFNLYQEDGTKVIPAAGEIVGLKSDGHAIVNAGTVNESGQVVITETAQITAAVGANVFEIVFDSVHGTANFILYVEKSPVDDDADFSESDISAIQQAIAMAIDAQTVAALQTGLQNEAQTRYEQDTLLAGGIAGEAATRAAADAVLRQAIDNAAIVPAGSTVVVDNTLSIAGAAADAKKTGDAVKQINTRISDDENANGVLYANAIDQSKVLLNSKVQDGVISETNDWFVTDIILLKANTTYYFDRLYYAWYGCYSTSDLSVLPSSAVTMDHISGSNFKGTITVGNSDVYFRGSGQTANLASAYISNVYNEYKSYGRITIDEHIETKYITPIETDIADIITIVGGIKYANEINPNTAIANKWINASTGEAVNANNWSATDFILLKAGKTYAFDKVYYAQNACYSVTDKTFISDPDITIEHIVGNNFKGTITVGNSDVYFRASIQTANVGVDAYISAYYSSYMPYGVIPIEVPDGTSGFEKCLIIGDSISAYNYGYYNKWSQYLIESGFLPTDTLNSSIHATGFVATLSGTGDDTFNVRLANVENPSSYDLVIIFGGINDYIQNIPFGVETDDYESYFIPAVNHFFDYLVTNFYNARIIIISPMRSARTDQNTQGKYSTDYFDYIKSKAKEFSLPLLNLTDESGFYPWVNAFKAQWTNENDGLHPNTAWSKNYLAPQIKHYIQLFKPDVE